MASEDMRLVSKSVRQNAKSAYGYKELEKLVKLIPLHPVFLIIGSCVQENVHRLKWCMLYHCGWKRIVSFKVVNWINSLVFGVSGLKRKCLTWLFL